MLRKNLPRQSWRSSETGHICEKMKCAQMQHNSDAAPKPSPEPDQLQLTTSGNHATTPAALP
jgi:hypothetical protein